MTSKIDELLARLRAAPGPGHKLDREIFLALNLANWEIETAHAMVATGQGDDYLPTHDDRRLRADCVAASHRYPEITKSMDAATNLIERLLPGWLWNLSGGGQERLCALWERDEPGAFRTSGSGATPALAAVMALLTALNPVLTSMTEQIADAMHQQAADS